MDGHIIDGKSFASQLDPSAEHLLPHRNWVFAQDTSTRVARDRRFKLFSTGSFYDIEADPNEKNDLANSDNSLVVSARLRLQKVLDQIPTDINLPFPYRSSSAFNQEAKKTAKGAKSKNVP